MNCEKDRPFISDELMGFVAFNSALFCVSACGPIFAQHTRLSNVNGNFAWQSICCDYLLWLFVIICVHLIFLYCFFCWWIWRAQTHHIHCAASAICSNYDDDEKKNCRAWISNLCQCNGFSQYVFLYSSWCGSCIKTNDSMCFFTLCVQV